MKVKTTQNMIKPIT